MFRCLACGEMIMLDSTACRFCGAPVDPVSARQACADLERVSSAISQANVMKYSLGPAVIVLVFAAAVVVVMPERLDLRILLVQIATPIGLVAALRWIRKYGALTTLEPDYPEAARSMIRVAWTWFGAIVMQTLLFVAYVARAITGV